MRTDTYFQGFRFRSKTKRTLHREITSLACDFMVDCGHCIQIWRALSWYIWQWRMQSTADSYNTYLIYFAAYMSLGSSCPHTSIHLPKAFPGINFWSYRVL